MNGDDYQIKAITHYKNKHKTSIQSGIVFQGGVDEMVLEIDNLPLRTGENLINTSDVKCSFSFMDVDAILKQWELAQDDSNSIVVQSHNKHNYEIEFNLKFREIQSDTANNSGPENIHIKNGYVKSEIRKFRSN